MKRYRFAIEYLGTDYAGWQIQPGQTTVQGELERALTVCLRVPTQVVGAGRTDAGVHASGQVAHFECEFDLDLGRIERSINALTADTIFVRRLELCPADFHARYSAQSRLYRYRIALMPTALHGSISWYPGYPLDLNLFRQALSSTIGQHDFVNFSVPREDGKSTLCKVLRAEADIDQERKFLTVTLEADRFLHKMVRSIVGASFDVARGALPVSLIKEILQGLYLGERTWAPAKGLCLEKVAYQDYQY